MCVSPALLWLIIAFGRNTDKVYHMQRDCVAWKQEYLDVSFLLEIKCCVLVLIAQNFDRKGNWLVFTFISLAWGNTDKPEQCEDMSELHKCKEAHSDGKWDAPVCEVFLSCSTKSLHNNSRPHHVTKTCSKNKTTNKGNCWKNKK